jgi:hypothetical protein
MQPATLQLKALGRMPDESDETLTSERIDAYAKLLKEVKKPVSREDAAALIGLFPESGLYGVEWTLLHLFESVQSANRAEYEALIAHCPSEEWRNTLQIRYNNWLEKSRCKE